MDPTWAVGRCLLLVEDDALNRLALAGLLEEAGFAVVTAGSYTEAANLLQRPRAYDAVLLDEGLGDGSGSELIPLVRHWMPGTKVVFVTGEQYVKAELRVDAVFHKGGLFDDLLAFLFKLMPRHP
jgi:DNA-binding response OmpR family regulator